MVQLPSTVYIIQKTMVMGGGGTDKMKRGGTVMITTVFIFHVDIDSNIGLIHKFVFNK